VDGTKAGAAGKRSRPKVTTPPTGNLHCHKKTENLGTTTWPVQGSGTGNQRPARVIFFPTPPGFPLAADTESLYSRHGAAFVCWYGGLSVNTGSGTTFVAAGLARTTWKPAGGMYTPGALGR